LSQRSSEAFVEEVWRGEFGPGYAVLLADPPGLGPCLDPW